MPDQNSPWVTLSSAVLTAQVDPLGAQLSVLRDQAQRDLLWNGDPQYWKGRAPILFPVVGAVKGGHYTFDGKEYPLAKHGFALFCPIPNVSEADFTRVYGDSFISGFTEGGEFNALVSIKFEDRDNAKKIGGDLKVEIDKKAFKVAGTATESRRVVPERSLMLT